MKVKFRQLPMRIKLTVSFSGPMIVIFVLLLSVSYRIIETQYEEQIIYSADQSFEQAVNFLQNHLQNMNYILELVGSDRKLQDMLSDGSYRIRQEAGDQWRDYWRINDIMTSLELSNKMYQCGIYVPDRLIYAENRYHFFPESDLKKKDYYEELGDRMNQGLIYFTGLERSGPEIVGVKKQRVAMLKKVYGDELGGGETCIARVSIAVDELERIVVNSDITQKGLSFLTNERGEILAVSNQENLETLSENGSLPGYGSNASWQDLRIGDASYLYRQQKLDQAEWMLVSLIPRQDFYRQTYLMGMTLILFSILIVLSIFLISWMLGKYYTKRLVALNTRMKQVQNGQLSLEVDVEESDEIGELFRSFGYMTKELRKLMLEQYRLGKNVKTAELRALQAQINPHFLYNTLDLINWEAMDYNAPEIMEIARNLAQFYRISLNKGRQIVRVEEELNHVRAYVRIENYHFDNAIHLEIDTEEGVEELACINIILQPFVENAIMYSIAKAPDRETCNIHIRAEREGEDLVFRITDDGFGMTREQTERIFEENSHDVSHGYGAKNVNFRIKLCYGEEYGVSYESEIGKGTTVTVRIPALTPEEAEKKLQ